MTKKRKLTIAIRDMNFLKNKEPFLGISLDLAIEALTKELEAIDGQ